VTFVWTNKAIQSAIASSKSLGIEWSVDRFLIVNGILSTHGWYGSTGVDIHNIKILLSFMDGPEESVGLELGLHRPDVQDAKPQLHSARGFFSHRAISNHEIPTSVSLLIELRDGTEVRVPVPFHSEAKQEVVVTGKTLLRHHAGRFFFHLFRGNWRLLWDRISKHLPALLARNVTAGALGPILSNLPENAVLIIDHAMGGGANHYRHDITQAHLNEGRPVLLWTFSPAALGFQLQILQPGAEKRLYGVKRAAWAELVNCRKITEVIFNNCVSFPTPEEMPEMLNNFLDRGTVKLILLVHDFYMACPSHFLLNKDGKYCGLPKLEVCRECLPKIDDGLVGLFQAKDIDLWRDRWGPVLGRADEVVCFSENTRALLRRAYPSLEIKKVLVRPHSVAYLTGNYRFPLNEAPLRLAIVGDINYHKGSEVFVDLAESARKQNLTIEFLVIGSLNAKSKPPEIVETGPYKRDDLADILSRYKIHMALMLSVWPETFSYVTHELIKLKVPLFSFDIGAQGDTVRQYSLGCVAPLCNGSDLLPVLLEFKKALDERTL